MTERVASVFLLYELYGKKPSIYFQWEIETDNSFEDGYKNYLVKSLKFVWGSLKDKADAAGNLPVEVALVAAHTSAQVTFHLMPMPGRAQASQPSNPNPNRPHPPNPPNNPLKRKREEDKKGGVKGRLRARVIARARANPKPPARSPTCPPNSVSSLQRTRQADVSATHTTSHKGVAVLPQVTRQPASAGPTSVSSAGAWGMASSPAPRLD